MVVCSSLKADGTPCKTHAIKGTSTCWFHSGRAGNSRKPNASVLLEMSKGAIASRKAESFSYRKIFGKKMGETPRVEKLKIFNAFYDEGGIVAQAIDSYVSTAVHNGYQLIDGKTGKSETDLTRIVNELDDRINIHESSVTVFLNTLISGFAWGEMEIDGKKITKLIFYPTHEIDMDRKRNGEIKEIRQIRGGKTIASWKGKTLGNVFLIQGKRKDSEPYAKGLMERIYADAKEHKEMGNDLAAVIKFTAYPFRVVKVGSDTYPASEAAVIKVANEVEGLEPGDWLATRHNLEFEFYNPDVPEAIAESFMAKTRELIVELGVPSLYTAMKDIDAGTLKEIRAIFNSTVRTLQITMARQFEKQIIDRQLELLGKNKIRSDLKQVILSWNPLTVSVLSILELTQLVTAGIISPDEARRVLESMGYGLLRGSEYIKEIMAHRDALAPPELENPKETHPTSDDPDKKPNKGTQKDGEQPRTKKPSNEPVIKRPQPNAPKMTADEWLKAMALLQNKNPYDANKILSDVLKRGWIPEKEPEIPSD